MASRGMHGQRGSLGEMRGPPMGNSPPNGPMPVPMNGFSHVRGGSAGAAAHPAHMSRSPPNGKNTSHVPCKFYRQGNCQAGAACPFLHTIEPDMPCKYFQMGKCKYGQKCALAHILPNGRRANPPGASRGGGGGGGGSNGGIRPTVVDAYGYSPEPQLFAQPGMPFVDRYQMSQEIGQARRSLDHGTALEGFGTSPRDSNLGSPLAHNRSPYSPKVTAQDVTLPSSFDSNAQSHYASLARHNGPISSSIPATTSLLGWSPFTSKTPTTSTTRQQAFGNLDSTLLGNGAQQAAFQDRLEASPLLGPSPAMQGIGQAKRPLHSDRRANNPSKASSSLPVESRHLPQVDDFSLDADKDADYGLEEDRVPEALNELLTPQERQRRFSRNQDDSGRPTLSGLGSPADSKVGSPSNASPSSRWGPLFERQRREASETLHPSSPSARGYFGSPLGRSPLANPQSGGGAFSSSPSFGVIGPPSKSGEVSPHVSSPPRASGMSLLSQQLKRTHLSAGSRLDQPDSGDGARPSTSLAGRAVSSSSIGSLLSGAGRFDRAVSSSSITHERIDEEPAEMPIFSMDDEEEAAAKDRKQRQETEAPASSGNSQPTSFAAVVERASAR